MKMMYNFSKLRGVVDSSTHAFQLIKLAYNKCEFNEIRKKCQSSKVLLIHKIWK